MIVKTVGSGQSAVNIGSIFMHGDGTCAMGIYRENAAAPA